MSRCPNCDYLVPPSWDACKKCGALLHAGAPAPSAPAPVPGRAPAAVASPGASPPPVTPPVAPLTAVPAELDLLPGRPTPAPSPGPTPRTDGDLLPAATRSTVVTVRVANEPLRRAKQRSRLVAVAAVVVAVGGAAWMLRPSSGGESQEAASDEIVILPPPEEVAAQPGLDAALRVEAEASVQRAVVVVSQAYAELGDPAQITPDLLGQYDPSLQFVTADQASTSAQVVSLRVSDDRIVVAVAGRGDVCAFGSVGVDLFVDRVTAETSSCRADAAPTSGWYGSGGSAGGGLGDGGAGVLTDIADV